MIPLVVSTLPPVPSSPLPSASANTSLFAQGQTDGSAASRQYLSTAVPSTTAPAAYFPGTAPQRQAQAYDRANKTERVQVPPPTGDFIEVREVMQPAAPPPPRSAPVTLGIPLTAQLNAQFMAQQQPETVKQFIDPFAKEEEKPTLPARNKEPSFATARGLTAYGFAAARNATIVAPPEAEPV